MIGNFTPEEYLQLKNLMSTVKDYIDPNQVHPIWNAYNKITNSSEPAPCTCNPRRWIDAVNEIRNFISQEDAK
jgi:hypothetical protein